MKRVIVFILIFGSAIYTYGQTYNSSCAIDEEIIKLYNFNAHELAIANSTTHTDSVAIDTALANKYLKTFGAVHNLQGIPERDTVIKYYNRILRDWYTNMWEVSAYILPGTKWMQNLVNGDTLSGNDTIDYLIQQHKFKIVYANDTGMYASYMRLALRSENYTNIQATIKLLESMSTVKEVIQPPVPAGGIACLDRTCYLNYEIEIYNNYNQITYTFWDQLDRHMRYTFKVFPDCRVELTNKEVLEGLEENEVVIYRLKKYNNREVNQWVIQSPEEAVVTIINLFGNKIYESRIIGLNNVYFNDLPKGMYILSVTTQGNTVIRKFYKY